MSGNTTNGNIPQLALALQYRGQYSSVIEAELDQLTSAIQQWANQINQAQGIWVDVPPNQLVFLTSTGLAGGWTPPVGNVVGVSYCLVGTSLKVRFHILSSPVVGTPSGVHIVLPIPYQMVFDPTRPVGYLHGIIVGKYPGPNVNKCVIIQDLDTYVDGIVSLCTRFGGVTLSIVPNAFGVISGTGTVGVAGQVEGEVQPINV